MLSGEAHDGAQDVAKRLAAQCVYERAELDGLRPRAEDEQDGLRRGDGIGRTTCDGK